jgi:hypothetical protein
LSVPAPVFPAARSAELRLAGARRAFLPRRSELTLPDSIVMEQGVVYGLERK